MDKLIFDEVTWSTTDTDIVSVEPGGLTVAVGGLGEAVVVLTGAEYGKLGEMRVNVIGLIASPDR